MIEWRTHTKGVYLSLCNRFKVEYKGGLFYAYTLGNAYEFKRSCLLGKKKTALAAKLLCQSIGIPALAKKAPEKLVAPPS